MENNITLIEIKEKLDKYKNYIIEYGFNSEQDIFINEDIKEFERILNIIEKDEE
tara:strand:- start:1813 stop:1974 length:162 start_codon:yes stop_codon:yes gene_type:complete